jgi:hypothetical protein
MKEKFYTCTLLSDVILNTSIQTEGNLTTLDHIPGSNFLGIVARAYDSFNPSEAYRVFHSGEVSFGDGLPYAEGNMTYHMPLCIMAPKGAPDDSETYLGYMVTDGISDKEGRPVQVKQQRRGYIDTSGTNLPAIRKSFRLKSAYDPEKRRSRNSAMFGFESIDAGQVFIFSIRYADDIEFGKIEHLLLGEHSIGKSRSAEYGSVLISSAKEPRQASSFKPSGDFHLVYAQSDLCFHDATGRPTLQPEAEQLGFSGGSIDWEMSHVRTHFYAPWNAKRWTTTTQRLTITMGSVFRVKGQYDGRVSAGVYQAEGLGRILVDPEFLEPLPDTFISAFIKTPKTTKKNNSEDKVLEPKTRLGIYLRTCKKEHENEKRISRKVVDTLDNTESQFFLKVPPSPSQLGMIRSAANMASDMNELITVLFGSPAEKDPDKKKKGLLKSGIAYEKYWSKKNGLPLKNFEKLIDINRSENPAFIALYCAELSHRITKGK